MENKNIDGYDFDHYKKVEETVPNSYSFYIPRDKSHRMRLIMDQLNSMDDLAERMILDLQEIRKFIEAQSLYEDKDKTDSTLKQGGCDGR